MEPVSYRLVRSDRKTLSLQISPQGELTVRSPRHMPIRQIEDFLREKTPWIRKTLEKIQSRPALPPLTRDQLQDLRREARQVFARRTEYFAPLVGVTYGRITLRMQKSRWGSCSSQGNLNFNILLLLAPPEVLDYVVVHELCHRREMNHSPAFWAQVERVLPDYRARRKWLKDNGGALMLRAPGEDPA